MNDESGQRQEEGQELNLRQLFEQYAYFWKWFVVSVLVCAAAAILYLRYAEKIYKIDAKILLQDEKKASGDLAGLSELASLAGGGSQASAFVSDQIDVIKSRRILTKVVNQNKLNIIYNAKGNVKKSELLENQSPVKLVILEPNNPKLDSVSYQVRIIVSGNTIKLSDQNQNIDNYAFGKKINTTIGAIMLVPNQGKKINHDMVIDVHPVQKVVDNLLGAIQVTPNKEKQSFIVNFSMSHPNREKAAIILNSLVQQYDVDATEDKVKVTRATSDFINNRLALITKDLSSSDSKVANYKDRNNLVDMSSEVQMYMQNATDNERKLIEYQTQLRLADMMRESVTSDNSLLPSNIGLNDPSIEASVKSYNELVLEREDLLKSATPDNPIVRNIEKNITDIRNNLTSSLRNYRNVLSTNVNVIQSQTNKYAGKLGQLPNQERDYKDIS